MTTTPSRWLVGRRCSIASLLSPHAVEKNPFVKRRRRKIPTRRGGGRDLGGVPPLPGGEDAAGHAAENSRALRDIRGGPSLEQKLSDQVYP
jgi:hypothetical protein